jgi:hypothetical protein
MAAAAEATAGAGTAVVPAAFGAAVLATSAADTVDTCI